MAANLGEADQPSAVVGEEGDRVRARQLGGLLRDAIGLGTVRLHVFGASVGAKRVDERAGGQRRERGGIVPGPQADVHGDRGRLSRSERPRQTG